MHCQCHAGLPQSLACKCQGRVHHHQPGGAAVRVCSRQDARGCSGHALLLLLRSSTWGPCPFSASGVYVKLFTSRHVTNLKSSSKHALIIIRVQVWASYSPVKNSPQDAVAKQKQGNPTHSATTGGRMCAHACSLAQPCVHTSLPPALV